MQFILGTVQFGLDYGISNENGQTTEQEVEKTLNAAHRNNIDTLDTACSYGNSEIVLGNILSKTKLNFKIITKTPHFLPEDSDQIKCDRLTASLESSLDKLQQSKIHGLLIHNADNASCAMLETMTHHKKNNLVEKIGISAYSMQQLEFLDHAPPIDFVQIPLNILDQRFIHSGFLKKLKEKNIEIHTRSVFLQGLLLMQPQKIPTYFDSIQTKLQNFHQECSRNRSSPLETAIAFVQQIKEVDRIVIGVNNSKQLLEIIKTTEKSMDINWNSFSVEDEKYINPSFWK